MATTTPSTAKRAPKKPTSSEISAPSKAPVKKASASDAKVSVESAPKNKKVKETLAVPTEAPAKKKVTKKAEVVDLKEDKTSKARPKPKASTKKPDDVTKKELKHLIAVAAYHRAEKRGFAPGYELQDWLDAEKEINAMIGLNQS